jgi:hypothetical protein
VDHFEIVVLVYAHLCLLPWTMEAYELAQEKTNRDTAKRIALRGNPVRFRHNG